MEIYQKLCECLMMRRDYLEINNSKMANKWKEQIQKIMDSAPHDSGFDNGTELSYDLGKYGGFTFTTSFHHMDSGHYDGWTEHLVKVKPHLRFGFVLEITGRNKHNIKEHIYEVFSWWLSQKCEDNPQDK